MAFLAALPGLIFGSGAAAAAGTAAAGASAGLSASSVLSAIGAGVTGVGTIASGVAAKRAADQDALNMEAQGKEELAASQRDAQQKRKEGALLASRQQALAAASGGGADDPTIVKLMTQAAGQTELNAQSAMYGGISRQTGLRSSAKARRAEGKSSLLGSVVGGFGQTASGIGNSFGLRDRTYG